MCTVAVRVPLVALPDPHWKVGDVSGESPDNSYQIGQLAIFNHEPEKGSENLMEIVFYSTTGKIQGSLFVRSIPYDEGIRLARVVLA